MLIVLLMLYSSVLHAQNHCVVLQYHHFSDATPAITSVTPEQFEQHLDYLKKNDFHVMALRDVVRALYNNLELPDKCVSLSVDDAYISVYTTAYPLLKQRGWPMTVFVNSQGVDRGIRSFMNWRQMREMAQHGFSFENHGHGHIHMIRRNADESEPDWLARVARDIQTAQQIITRETGMAPALFAFPYGEYNPSLIRLVEDMGLTGFGQQSGPVWPGANFGALPRFPMAAHYARLKSFTTKVNTLPLPVVRALPIDPMTPLGQKRPTLTLQLAPGTYDRNNLRCFVSGSDQVTLKWLEQPADSVEVTPQFDLKPGRHRTNCTMPSGRKERFHWYSHNWFVRNPDGSWYAEY
jgi:peptidoglycan/xylan/chitin deacetylase (PgdA/CDA1 family)